MLPSEKSEANTPKVALGGIFRGRGFFTSRGKPTNNRAQAADRDIIRFRPGALLGAGVIVALLFFGREVFIPLSLAVLLSFLLAIPCTFLERHGIKRVFAVLLLVGVSFASIAGIGWLISTQLLDLAAELPNYEQTIETKLASLKASPNSTLGKVTRMLRRTADELQAPDSKEQGSRTAGKETTPGDGKPTPPPIPVEVHQPAHGAFEVLGKMLAPFVKSLATGVMVLVVLVFMLLGREDLRNRVIRLAGTDRMDLTTDALDEAAGRVSRFLVMQLIVNCCFGLLIGLGLYFIGVPSPMLWGTLAMLLRFIPYVGAWIAAAAPLILAFAIQPGWGKLAGTGGLFLTVELLTGNIIEPLLYGSSTGVSPVALVLAAIFWTWLWGPIGLLLSTPMTVCLAVIGLHVPQLRFLHVLLGDEPVLTPESRFYQRMLAMDRHEVDGIVKGFIKDKPLSAAYEQLMIRSLMYAKEDLEKGRLTQERENFVLENIGELVEELAEDEEERMESSPEQKDNPPLRLTEVVTSVAVMSSSDRADEIAGTMFAKLLAHRGIAVRVLRATALEDSIDPTLGSIRTVCLSAVPPILGRRTRYLCKRIRSRFPDIKLVIAVWGSEDDPNGIRESLATCRPDRIVTRLDEAIAAVISLSGIAGLRQPSQTGQIETHSLQKSA